LPLLASGNKLTSLQGPDDLPDDDFSDDDSPRSRSGRKRKRTVSVSSEAVSSPKAGWTRKPPKAAPKKKKKKLVAGRELRDRKQRKTYAEESSGSDKDFQESEGDENDDEQQEDQKDEHVEEEQQPEEDEDEFDEEDAPLAPKTRKITLRLKSNVLQELSQSSMPPEEHPGANGNGTPAAETTEDLEAEIADLKDEMVVEIMDEDEEDYQPRRLTRRSTRQSSLSTQKENVSDRPTHGRKGVGRQDGSSKKTNGDEQSARRRRLENLSRKSRKSYEEKKRKRHVSESEFEDDGDEEPDDEVSAVSANDDEGSQGEYSSPARRPKKKSSQPRPKPNKKRSRRNSSEYDDESVADVNDLEEELREIGAEIPQRQRQLRPTERMNYFIPPPLDKDDSFFAGGSPTKKRGNSGRALGGFGGFGGDFSGMGLSDRFRGVAGLGTAGGADNSSDSVSTSLSYLSDGVG
jgi:hypothetical protein